MTYRVRKLRAWLNEHVIQRPVTAAIISFGALAIGAILSIWPKEIAEATRIAVVGPQRGAPHWFAVTLWIGVVFWTVILYYRLKSDDQTERARFDQLTAAIHRAPDYTVFAIYPELYDKAADAVASTHTRSGSEEERINKLEVGLQLVLQLAATLAAEFSRAPEEKAYGANVMLVAKPPFAPELIDALRFFDKDNQDANTSLAAVLYMPRALLLADAAEQHRRNIPFIALPVPHRTLDKRGNRLALPGAPWALLEGVQSAQLDTSKMSAECDGMSASIIQEVEEYFSPTGAGKDVKSFVSFRIGSEDSPIGVLNIDSNETDVLGPELEYYQTFYALATPVVRLLHKPLLEYAGLMSDKGEFFGEMLNIDLI